MIDVILVDDDREFSEYIIEYLKNAEDIRFCGYYEDCEKALEDIDNSLPDLILLDIVIPGKMSGIEAIPLFKEKLKDVTIAMLSKFDEKEYLFQALQNGADGYLLKSSGEEIIIKIIKEMNEGGAPIDMAIAKKLVEYFHQNPPSIQLTERQKQILEKLCQGMSNKQIANELFISLSTVKFHIRNIYQILHVTCKAQAAAKAIKNKLIDF
ncbi:response regulator [Calditrichota bacterium GD2]